MPTTSRHRWTPRPRDSPISVDPHRGVRVRYTESRFRRKAVADFLRGNYRLPKAANRKAHNRRTPKSLTEQLEESALAKLGGSIFFVMKGKTFVWASGGGGES